MTAEGTPTTPSADEHAADKAKSCDHADVKIGEKCHECGVDVMFRSFGGAQSFAELDEFEDAQDVQDNVSRLSWQFESLVRNIFADESLSLAEKTQRVQTATAEMKDRVDDPEATKDIDLATASADELEAHRLAARGQKQTTKTEGGIAFRASDFADVPDRETPSTWKLRLAAGSSGNFTVAQVARAITAMQPSGFRGNVVELGQPRATVVAKIRRTIGRTEGTDAQKANLRERLNAVKELPAFGISPAGGSITIKEHADGSLTWLGIYSNGAWDKDQEAIPEARHKEFADYCTKTGDYPELWAWHTPGTKFGTTKELAVIEGFAIAVGTIDGGKEHIARNLESMGDLQMSHGFRYDDKSDDGVFGEYRSYEISVLPAGAAANPFTGWGMSPAEVITMGEKMDARKREFFEGLGFDVDAISEGVGKLRKALEAEGVEFKEAAPVIMSDLFEIDVPTAGDAKGDEDAGDGKPDADASAKGGDPVMDAIKEGFADLNTRLDDHQKQIDELGESKETGIRQLFAGKGIRPVAPSEDPSNVADGRKTDVRERNANDKDDSVREELRPYVDAMKGAG